MKNVLIIGGYEMLLADPDDYWALADRLTAAGFNVRCKECDQDWAFAGARQKATAADILWADIVICYSYGMATYKNICHDLAKTWPVDKFHDMVIVVAGVPDAWMLQFYGNIWHLGSYVKKARYFNVDATPASAGCKDEGVEDFEWYEDIGPEDFRVNALDGVTGVLSPQDLSRVNINCNRLVESLDPVSKHTHIKDNPALLQAIFDMVLSEQ